MSLCYMNTEYTVRTKWIVTVASKTPSFPFPVYINSSTFFILMFRALNPKTNSSASMMLDLPLPLGPIMHEKDCDKCKNVK